MLIQKIVCYEHQVQSFFNRKEDREGNKQLPYTQSKHEFLMTAIDHYVRSFIKNKTIKQ